MAPREYRLIELQVLPHVILVIVFIVPIVVAIVVILALALGLALRHATMLCMMLGIAILGMITAAVPLPGPVVVGNFAAVIILIEMTVIGILVLILVLRIVSILVAVLERGRGKS